MLSTFQRTWDFKEGTPLFSMFVLILLPYHHVTRANNIALLAFLLMSQFVCAFHFFVTSTAWHLQLVAAPHVAFSVIDGESIVESTSQKACLIMITTCHNFVEVNRISLRDKRFRPIHVVLQLQKQKGFL